MVASIGCSLFPGGFLFQNHYPRFRGAPSAFFKGCPQGRPTVDSGLGYTWASDVAELASPMNRKAASVNGFAN